MKTRKLISVITIFFIILSFPGSAFALSEDTQENPPDVPRYQYVERINVSLSISQGTANMGIKVEDTNGDTTKLACTMYLQKHSGGAWSSIKSWSKSTNSNTLVMSHSKAVSKGTYRVKAVVKAYKGNCCNNQYAVSDDVLFQHARSGKCKHR